MLKIIFASGSGPHGVAWWNEFISFSYDIGSSEEIPSVEWLAEQIRKNCWDEGNSSYWAPWRDGHPKRTLLFLDRSIDETEDREVEEEHEWREGEFEEAEARANQLDAEGAP